MLDKTEHDSRVTLNPAVAVPAYLQNVYWWTYIHPLAVAAFDHLWVVNLILLTQYNRMRNAALAMFADMEKGCKVLQISCAYGDLMPRLAGIVAKAGGTLDILDVLPIQLNNAAHKLAPNLPVRFWHRNAAETGLPNASYHRVLLFFLLHEVPMDVRRKVLAEALRVAKPGGQVVLVDFAMPRWWNPFRYLWAVFLAVFEPFAREMWQQDILTMLPPGVQEADLTRTRYFGGLFQRVVVAIK
jgi:ubiquinone/menaquinone biosynthesis C-methylase UbiE